MRSLEPFARLRAKVEPDAGSPKYITTRPGIGYTLNKLTPAAVV